MSDWRIWKQLDFIHSLKQMAEKDESQLKEWINEKYTLTITYSDLRWVNEKPHEVPGWRADGAYKDNSQVRTSDLKCISRWLVSSNRGLGQFRQANNNIPERDPNMGLMTSGKTHATSDSVTNFILLLKEIIEELSATELCTLSRLTCYLPLSPVTSFIKGVSLISSEGNNPYRYKFERMNGKTEAIHYHHSEKNAASIPVKSQQNFWHLVPKIVVNIYANQVRI